MRPLDGDELIIENARRVKIRKTETVRSCCNHPGLIILFR